LISLPLRPQRFTLFPYTTLFRSYQTVSFASAEEFLVAERLNEIQCMILDLELGGMDGLALQGQLAAANLRIPIIFLTAHCTETADRKSTRLNSSHGSISYAVFCL